MAEQFALDGLELMDSAVYQMHGLTVGGPTIKQQWTEGAGSDGELPADDARWGNRTVSFEVRCRPGDDMDGALASLQEIVFRLGRARRLARGGGSVDVVWTPDGASSSLVLKCLGGEVEDIDRAVGDGWALGWPGLEVTLTCLPFGEGGEVSLGAVSAALPLATYLVPGVPGDVRAKVRIVVGDDAVQARRYVAVGRESERTGFDSASVQPLIVDSDDLVPASNGTRAGAYDPDGLGNSVVSATVTATAATAPQVVATTADLGHVGSFQALARVYASADVWLRWSVRVGGGEWASNGWVAPPLTSGWGLVRLGLVDLSAPVTGLHRWLGRLEAFGASLPTVDVDYVVLMPAGQWAAASSEASSAAAAVVAGGAVEFRHDGVVHLDGGYWGRVARVRGAHEWFVDPGDNRLAVLAARSDLGSEAYDDVADSTSVQVHYTPRYLYLPPT